MRKQIVAGNWKLNTTPSNGVQLATDLMKLLNENPQPEGVGVAIAPPFTHLMEVAKVIDPKKYAWLPKTVPLQRAEPSLVKSLRRCYPTSELWLSLLATPKDDRSFTKIMRSWQQKWTKS